MSSKYHLREDSGLDILFSNPPPTYKMFLESLWQKKINYYHISQFDLNHDDQAYRECHLSVSSSLEIWWIFPFQSPHILHFENPWDQSKPNIALLVNFTTWP